MKALYATTVAVLACVAASCQAQQLEEGLPHGIVLVTLDTVRADHLSSYGYHRDTSPNLDALAADGARFANVLSPMPTTDPAHVSLFTGLYPRTHGILENGVPMADPDVPNLAAWAKAHGYATAAFISRKHLVPSELALRGFEDESGPAGKERRGDETLELATRWLEEHAERPFFLWLHFFDPHYPYEAPEPWGSRYAGPDHPAPVERDNREPSREPYGEDQLTLLEDLYDGEIAYTDHLLGVLLERLDALYPQRTDGPLIVVTGDHGEMMDEAEKRHRFCFDHGKWLYQGALEVPLVIHWPGHVRAGIVPEGIVELVDIPATVLGLLDEPRFLDQGESLVPLLVGATRDGALGPAYAFTQRRALDPDEEAAMAAWQRLAVQDARHKLVRYAGGSSRLFDLHEDPWERREVSARLPEVHRRLESALDEWLAVTPEGREAGEGAIPEEKLEALRSLGYVD